MKYLCPQKAFAAAPEKKAPGAKRAQAGFTLIEVLAALAILAILGTVVVAAMATGTRVMNSSVNGANASVLAQSLDTALSDVLRYANVQAPAGQQIIENPEFNSDSYTDYMGAAVRGGHIEIDEQGHLALAAGGYSQPIPKAAGIYTEFIVTDFSVSYNCDTNLFEGSYTISLPDGTFARTCSFACRTLVDETQI